MLRKKFFAPSKSYVVAPLPGESYYAPTKRDATAAAASVTGLQFAPALVISKGRNVARDTAVFDTSRAALKRLNMTTQQAEITDTNTLTAFNALGYDIGADTPGIINSAVGARFVNWAFAKAPGFLDIQTYTGNSTAGTLVAHNLGVMPDLVIAKCRSAAGLDWPVRVRGQIGDLYWNKNSALTPSTGNVEVIALSALPAAARAQTGMAVNNATIVAARAGTAEADYSTNGGTTWEVIPLPARFGCVAFSATLGLFVASSQYVANGVFSSVDGRTWTQGVSADYIGNNINWCNNEFLSTSSGNIYKSVNGTTWTKIVTPFPVTAGKGQWSYICYGNGVYVAVTAGDGGADKSTSNRCGAAYSHDGVTWAVADPTGVLTSAITYLTKIVFGNGVFVATGPGGFALRNNHNVINDVVQTNAAQSYFSVDGITWNPMGAFPVAGNWGNLTFGNGQFIAISANTWGTAASYPSTTPSPSSATTAVIYSADGATWKSSNVPVAGFWAGMDYSVSASRFYALSNSTLGYSMITNASSANMYNLLTATVSLGASSQTNAAGQTYVMYLFTSKTGICKIGSYTGNGGIQAIDCGFATPPRFIMVKRIDTTSDWGIWDSARGLTGTGPNPFSLVNTTGVEVNSAVLNSTPTGFKVDETSGGGINVTNGVYIYMAIA